MLILFYLFSGGKLEDNLVGIFNLFDADGNKVTPPPNMFLMDLSAFNPSFKVITLNELYEMMAVMIEIGEGKDHKVS